MVQKAQAYPARRRWGWNALVNWMAIFMKVSPRHLGLWRASTSWRPYWCCGR